MEEKMTMKDYIHQTVDIAFDNIENYQELTQSVYEIMKDKVIDTIWLVASGSSYNGCFCARPFMKKCLSSEIKIVTPYTFTYYEHNIKENDLVLVITQSGLSTNAIEAIKKLNELNQFSICLTGNPNSDVKEYASLVVDYGVKEELVGYVTKGVTTLCLYLMLLAIRCSQKIEYLAEIKKAFDLNQEMQEKADIFIEKHYKELSSMHQTYLCGAGSNYGTALEGALKIGELVHIPSSCYEIEEYIHGPNLQLTPSYTVFLFDNHDKASNRVKQVYLATKEVTDRVYLISNQKDFINDDHVLSLSKTIMNELCPLAYLPFVQILSYKISNDLKSNFQHPLLKRFKKIASAKTSNFINYDGDE